MLNSKVRNDAISIEGLSNEIYLADHPNDNKIWRVIFYYREGLPIKRRKDLELLQELVVDEITISSKKILLYKIYRSPSQKSGQFDNFINRHTKNLSNVHKERPHSIILTRDFNCRSSQVGVRCGGA